MQSLTVRSMRVLGALAVLAVGAVHLQQYLGSGYHAVPTIGPLFLLNAAAAGVIGVGLLVPFERWLPAQPAEATLGLLAAAGVAVAAGALIALFISEASSLFGFTEDGYTSAVVTAIAAEAAAILLLAPVAVKALGRFLSRRGMAATRSSPRDELQTRRSSGPALQRH